MPELTMHDAERAFGLIKTVYARFIRAEFNHETARDVYVFCSETEFELYFQMTYITAFKKANAVLIPNLIKSTQINGFVNAEADYDARRIFIPKRNDPNLKWGTLAHEAIHYFSAKEFYPNFYKQGGMRPFQVEGATEVLTRDADIELRGRKNYENNYRRTIAWLGADGNNFNRMCIFLFRGIATNMDAIHT